MKKFVSVIFAIIAITFIFNFFACGKGENAQQTDNTQEKTIDYTDEPETDRTDENLFIYSETEDAVIITGLSATDLTELSVPAKIHGKPVRAIAEHAFQNNNKLQSVSVPKSVEYIGYGALSGCSAVFSLTLPFTGESHKTEVGLKSYPFGHIFGETPYEGGLQITQYYYFDSTEYVNSSDYYIPAALKEVKITGVDDTHLPYAAFYNCSHIDKITIGENITSIGEFAFSGITGSIVWENPSIERIDPYAFSDFKGTALTIPESVKSIGKGAFSDCVYLRGITIPDAVETLDLYAFGFCYELSSVKIGKNVRKIPVGTFYFCIKLKDLSLPENLEEIDDGAFNCCKALETVSIPARVKRINANAFKSCAKLKTADFKNADGWRYFSIMTSGDRLPRDKIADTSAAASYLTKTYCDYIWERFYD
ncbi:MAG: leucine-rich repeat domain-containing protein [Clostridia bacterium]|nr:leucine-rich repeat domain-containing protein [Clostridia bacterium]